MQSLLWLGAPCLFTSNFGVAAINAVNSGSESWTGIGVVAGCCAVVLIMQWPRGRNGDVIWRSKLLQILQEVRTICKTRNQLNACTQERDHVEAGQLWSVTDSMRGCS